MRLFYGNDHAVFVLRGDEAVDVTSLLTDLPHLSREDLMAALIAQFDAYRAQIESFVKAATGVPLSSVKIQAPLPRPRNIVCMATNYMEDGTLPEPPPINAFHKVMGAIIGPGDTMILPDAPASNFECEAEVAVVIGKRASNISEAEAMDHIFGYMNFMDGSARGLPPERNVFFQGKSRETFAPTGPWIVTADEIADPYDMAIQLRVNGVLKQDFNTSDMAHNIARCISWASSIHTLEPGDILATGTNHRGLSSIQNGDTIELECSGLGQLRITVKDDLHRTWPRETRLERTQKGLPALPPQTSGKYAKDAVEA
ncbi:fumarylacetoacetate hydrolase family protein [Roseicyclus mahoneyensis]|uniref:2-keto-4-pentenoate hydratase/2-oxohepta-3-ene-1,7-dioic acid hydratase in catechol pathway n=1 Tax=Roseicyclus mahoneyensis TaxID=164332 RepID=A0A316GVP7_9RHOB|nr:fumarylacetoacetate hydrolase family protein [Roseicyclus mahoneyensis]PWK59147.1 2-keto-4-pentenoate hydratase/2-oxohepta-3-ene-1,7-dioic acid hydratase in catechol pathway [Roseicyclus mahoneyensis]